tara:strand:+ start:11031 stop:16691 length:5661 start_codon:yes stop_codon:yes gene_type:complete
MSRNNFLVKKLKFEIDIQDDRDFKDVASNVSQLSNDFLNLNFQTLADSILSDNEQIYIDRIVLDIGEISFDNKAAISEQIIDLLKKKIQKAQGTVSNKSRSNEILIAHFLSKGFLPWWASTNDRFNAFLASNAYSLDLESDVFELITKNRSTFKRFMNALNTKNKAVFIKAYLKKNNTFYQKSVALFVKLLETILGTMDPSNEAFIQYELLKTLVKYPNKTEGSYAVVFNKIIEDLNIEWEVVSKVILSNPNDYKPFSNFESLNDKSLLFQQRSNKSKLSKLAQIKLYIERGLLNESSAFETSYLTVLFSNLMKTERDALIIIFSQLNIYNHPLQLIRVSKLLNSENLLPFLVLIFDTSKGHLLRQLFSFLNSLEFKGNSNETSFFYFINTVLKLKSSSDTKKRQFYKTLMKLISNNYKLDYKDFIGDFYFFSTLQNSQNDYQSVIESYYLNEISDEEDAILGHFVGHLKSAHTFSYPSLLSSNQIIQFNLLKKYIEYLNQSVVSNSWNQIVTEKFIFTQLTEQKTTLRNFIFTVLQAYAAKNSYPFQSLIIAVLTQFYSKLSLSEADNVEIIECIMLVSQPETFNTLSKKEQFQINEIVQEKNIKNKLELVDYKFNLELSSKSFQSDLEYLQELKHQDLFFKQTYSYLVQELQPLLYSNTKLKLNIDQLSQVVKIELKKHITGKNDINYQNIVESIAAIYLLDANTLNIDLLKNVINKLSYQTNDEILIRQINDTIFSFSNVKHTTKKIINSVFEINQKITDINLKKSILVDYIINSPLVVLKLNDKNYKNLIQNLAANKQNNYFLILNKILFSIPYQKKIEFSSILKYKALLISRYNNLSDEQFLLQLLDEISSLDPTLLKKIRNNLTQNTAIQDAVDTEHSDVSDSKRPYDALEGSNDVKSQTEDTTTQNSGVTDGRLETDIKRKFQEFESKQISGTATNAQILNITPVQYKPINSFSHRDFEFFMNLKNELITDNNQKFSNYDSFNTIEEIVKSDSKLLEFLNLYIDDYEILIEFAQSSFKDPVKSRLESLSKSKNLKLFEMEKELITLQKSTLFTILTSIEFKTILRVYMLKSLAFVKKNKKFIISEFTLNFIETLSENRKLNYRGTSDIASKVNTKSSISQQIKEGVVSFFDKNKFEAISKEVKNDEYFKNIVSFFLKTNKVPVWSESQKLSLEEALNYIKIRIKKSDSLYINELLSEKKPTSIIASAFKKESHDFKLEVLKLLELSNAKSYSIKTLYENLIQLNSSSEGEKDYFFEQILLENLWEKPSLLSVLDSLFSNEKNIKLAKNSKVINTLKKKYPSLELVLKPVKEIDTAHKIELIRYFIERGQLPKVFQLKNALNFQLLKAYTAKNKSQFKLLLREYSATPDVSKNFIELSSNAIFVELLLEELEEKNLELKYLFEKVLKPSPPKPTPKETDVYDLVLKFLIAPKTIQQSNFKALLSTLKASSNEVYDLLMTAATELVSDASVTNQNGILMASLTFVSPDGVEKDVAKGSKEVPSVIIKEEKRSEFDTFIKDLRYFVEFNSFSRTTERTHPEKFHTSIFKFKSNLILKKQLYNWANDKTKIFNLFRLIPENEVSDLLEFIHPNQLNYIKTFNSILEQINYRSIQECLKLDSIQKFTYKVLNAWSSHSIVINTPETIFHTLFEEFLDRFNIDTETFVAQIEAVKPTFNSKQKALIKSITQKSIISTPSKTTEELPVVEETVVDLDNEESVYINNAGLIIVWPFLTTLFSKLGFTEGREFKDDYSLQKAILLLQYIVFGDVHVDETNLVLNKIMCGAAPDFFVDTSIELNDMDKSIGDSMLTAVTKNWEQLNSSNIQTLREYFLKRDGVLKKMNENYMLNVEGNTFDVLLKSIPWNILMLQTAYMDNRLIVEWKY